MAGDKEKEWFEEWFNTPFYHKLYQHRDNNEAAYFVRNLIEKIGPEPGSHLLDLACGRGRHACRLHKMGFEVTGIDLSPRNIEHARHWADEGLHFEVGDMRDDLGTEKYDHIFNLFTSFGYFDQMSENILAAQRMQKALKPGGCVIIDFMNVHRVAQRLVEEEEKVVEGVAFNIKRSLRKDRIIKSISFEWEGRNYSYEEQVQLLEKPDFQRIFAESNLMLTATYGDFDLRDFHPDQSDRLILLAQKK